MAQRWEFCDGWSNVFGTISDAWYQGQTFKVLGTSHSVTSVKMLITRSGNPGLLTVGIKPVLMIPDPYTPEVIGVPTAGYLASTTFNPATIPAFPVRTLVEITLPEVMLVSGVVYTLATELPGGAGANWVAWAEIQNPNLLYADGHPFIYDVVGVEWSFQAFDFDFYFEIFGNAGQSIVNETTSEYASSEITRVRTVRHVTDLTPWTV